jgi:hypothetical protein
METNFLDHNDKQFWITTRPQRGAVGTVSEAMNSGRAKEFLASSVSANIAGPKGRSTWTLHRKETPRPGGNE